MHQPMMEVLHRKDWSYHRREGAVIVRAVKRCHMEEGCPLAPQWWLVYQQDDCQREMISCTVHMPQAICGVGLRAIFKGIYHAAEETVLFEEFHLHPRPIETTDQTPETT